MVVRVQDESGSLIYGQIEDIYVHNDHKIFVLSVVKIVQYVEHLRAIEIEITDRTLLCLNEDIFRHGVLHIKQKAGRLYIIDYEFRVSY